MREGITQSESAARKESSVDNLNLIEQGIGGSGICLEESFQQLQPFIDCWD